MEVLTSILVSVAGFIIGGVIMIGIGSITVKYFVRKIVQETISEETKNKLSTWLEESFKNGIGKALRDEDTKLLIVEILNYLMKKLDAEEEKKKS